MSSVGADSGPSDLSVPGANRVCGAGREQPYVRPRSCVQRLHAFVTPSNAAEPVRAPADAMSISAGFRAAH